MKRFYLTLLANLVFAALLAFLTIQSLALASGTSRNDMFGWLSLTPIGPASSLALVLLIVTSFALDFLWALFFIIWLIKKKLHIKDKDNTLYLR